MAKKPKPGSLSFRVPEEIRKLIAEGKEATGESQSDYIVNAAKQMIAKMKNMDTVDDIALPKGYQIPNTNSKMMTVRIDPTIPARIKATAPRFFHSLARFLLWSIEHRALAGHPKTEEDVPSSE